MNEIKVSDKYIYSSMPFSVYISRLPTSLLLLTRTARQSVNSSANFPHFLEPEVSFLGSLRPATGVYHEPHQSYTYSFKIHFNIIIHQYSLINAS